MTDASRRVWLAAALVGVAAVWGATFVMVKDAVALYPLYGFLGWRFTIAVVAFLILFPRSVRLFQPGTLRVGLLAGSFLTAGYVFQTWGLQDTSASKAAFITGMFVVITPLLQTVILKRMPRWPTTVGILIAVAGLWLLSGASADGWNVGDTRVLLCAVAYSAHMIVLGSLGRDHDVRALTLVQLAVGAVVCVGISAAIEQPGIPTESSVWIALLVTGVLATAVAFAVQTAAQKVISPAKTALILITEPAFGGLFGWLAGETLGLGGLVGAALIIGGMIVSELVGSYVRRDENVVLEVAIEGPSAPIVEQDDGSS